MLSDRVLDVRQCEHCGHRFTQASEEVRSQVVERRSPENDRIAWYAVRCPACENEWPLSEATVTRGRVKCVGCGMFFELFTNDND
jgi:ribosomal protein S27E